MAHDDAMNSARFRAALRRNWGLLLAIVLVFGWLAAIQYLFQNGVQG